MVKCLKCGEEPNGVVKIWSNGRYCCSATCPNGHIVYQWEEEED